MRKLKWIIPAILLVLSVVYLFRPAGKITFDKSVSKNRFLLQYEMFGCGSLIRKVADGGKEITADYINEYPDIGIDEVKFTEDSDEPENHVFVGEFYAGGFAERYQYIIEGAPIGVTQGASECCSPEPAYNEKVVEFKVDDWYFTSYVPYISCWNINPYVLLAVIGVLFLSALWLLGLALESVYSTVRYRILKGRDDCDAC